MCDDRQYVDDRLSSNLELLKANSGRGAIDSIFAVKRSRLGPSLIKTKFKVNRTLIK